MNGSERGVPVFGDPAALTVLPRAENGRERQGTGFCGLCGAILRGKPGQRYCGTACRAAAWKARRARAIRAKYRPLRPTALRILARLERRPASAGELLLVGGKRYGARIHELRQRGHRIHCYVHRLPGEIEGRSVYWSAEWMAS